MSVYQVNKLYIACYIQEYYNKTVAVRNIARNKSVNQACHRKVLRRIKKSGKSAFHRCNDGINSIFQSNTMTNYCISSCKCPRSKKCPPPRPIYAVSLPIEKSLFALPHFPK